ISDGKPLYVFTNITSGQRLELSVEGNVSDGQWHVLKLHRGGSYISLFLDERPVMNTTNGTKTYSAFFVETIFLGSAPLRESRDFPGMIQNLGFRGCVEYFKFNGHLLSFNEYNEIVDANSSPSVFQTFCISPNHCVLTPCLKDSCLSEPCWNDSDCGSSSKDDYWCICLHNVSSCGSCSSDIVHSEACSQSQKSVPLWIVAVILPIVLILLILVLCIVLRRQGKLCEGEKRSQIYLMPPSKQHGMDNLGFRLDPPEESPRHVSNETNKQPDLIKSRDSMQGMESHTESGPSCHVSGFGGSELEYYEIDSTYSDVKTLQLKTEDERGDQVNDDPKVPQSTMQPQTNHKASPKLHQRTSGGDFHQWQRQSQLFFRRKLACDLLGPPQHLSADEVEKLNTPRDHKGYPHQNFRACPMKPSRDGEIETSSESESHLSFTGSELDCERELSLISSLDKDEHPPGGKDTCAI
ncbi:hypothetical protein M9458_030633, partial [Cirrhinus mrigala]